MIIQNLQISKNSLFFTLFLLFVFMINILFNYLSYKELKKEYIFETKAEVLNIYPKEKFDVIKLKGDGFEFFASFSKDENIKKLDSLNVVFDTRNITFYTYLKGFFTKILYFEKGEKNNSVKEKIIKNIEENHDDFMIRELFNALFLAIPVSSQLRDIITAYGIAHVVALSGFHIVVLSFIIYWILYFPYSFLQNRYFPYRNRRFDILLITMAILFYYLLLTDIVPSLLRAFVLFSLGLYLLRSNIKVISYLTLFYTFLIVIALFPQYIFNIGFWFSIFAVFYIYLFIQYFKNGNKILLYIFFNIWMFLIFNPIVHFFFAQTAIEQFYSIPITIFFTIFYPLEIVAHIFNISSYFDDYLKIFLENKIYVYEVFTPLYFFILYILFSFFSIWSKKSFFILNILMIGFNFYLYISGYI
ncbi:ComEC/Rec2 family competence protein [Aliarcobacter cryaerophilus]|uniref:ComEC/Rec2 family competence protein n=5 Tax=Arcobacteraceae TaxID=2808963 RepID=A0AA96D3W1_9BACT|nr:ComEC/Rec2 family competence protein [Arcobacter sp. AZ-2023]WPD10104.1 ComEC/Rec2 family competence protein [Arcobacter sp. DSM 115954]WNL14935.1 ComEC/Rec2 family competence protein [Arcobacter sp. AZ-2023]WNL19182.1 ComEC/Rec2 family competence protein [Arcobacter sp. AZ-2023]WNL21321.1 ComEC/Rec2 family competence protein [Arcobacter sp. AZ-2023]